MKIEPRIMNNICLTAHPTGLKQMVKNQIEYVKKQGSIDMPKRVLVVGGSTGFGLATRIAAAFGGGADTVSVSFEKEPQEKRTGTPGWYNNCAFRQEALKEGLVAENINGDAFSYEIKNEAVAAIKKHLGQVDMVVYSLASPVRIDPDTKEMYKSVLKPMKETYKATSVNFVTEQISDVEIEPATDAEAAATVKVMGGEDWQLWINTLKNHNLLAKGCVTMAYSYIGPEVTYPVYRAGTIGKAKEHLEATALDLNKMMSREIGGRAFVSVNKALVTRASSVIPVVPLYISMLFKVMKEKGTHEGCIEQMDRMLRDKIYGGNGIVLEDSTKLMRMDDWEMDEEVQAKVKELWDQVTPENLLDITDIHDFRTQYLQLHGFEVEGVDYDEDVSPLCECDSDCPKKKRSA